MKKLMFLCVVAMIAAPAAFGELLPAPVALWTFDDGTAADVSGYGTAMNGTLHGGAAIVTDAERGKVASFDGANGSYIDCGPVLDKIRTATTNFTLATWVKAKPTSDIDGNWKYMVGSGRGYTYLMNTADATVYIMTITGSSTGNTACWTGPEVDTWYHLAMTYDGSYQTMYINGVEVVATATTGAGWGATDDRTFTMGGAWTNSPGWYAGDEFRGLLDDVRWYNTALNADQVEALYNTIPEPCTIALFGVGIVMGLRRRIA